MPTKRGRRTRQIRFAPLTEGQIHYLKTGELVDFSSFQVCTGRNFETDREQFKAIRAAYRPGTFPWAEAKFCGDAG